MNQTTSTNPNHPPPPSKLATFNHDDLDSLEENADDAIKLTSDDDAILSVNEACPSVEETRMAFHRLSGETFKSLCASFRTTDPHKLASLAASDVKHQFRTNLNESLLNAYQDRDIAAPFSAKEICLGKKLGSGEFSHVYQVNSFRLDESSSSTLSEKELEMRQYMKSREKYHSTNKRSYALKHLRPELLSKYTSGEYARFASDLVMECELLSLLQHPNIIKLRGMANEDYVGFESGPKGYFLIIDRLDDTLGGRINKWKKASNKNFLQKSLIKKPTDVDGDNKGNNELLSKQLEVMLQLSAAMVYLHEKHIIYRDLKPENVGFDVRGDVKLFDFGLAKIMPPNGDTYQDSFEMSGAGSPRYMSPEVMSGETYNLKADVYCFGVVFWEVLALERPFGFVRGRAELAEYVVNHGGRPEIKPEWPNSIKEILQHSFDTSEERPTMEHIFESIRSELCLMRNGDDSKLRHSYLLRRRSMASMRAVDDGVKRQNKARQLRSSLASSITKIGRQFSL